MKAGELFARALELDPGNIRALVGSAVADVHTCFSTDDPQSALEAAERKLARALTAAPNLAWAHTAMGMALAMTKRAARGMEAFERALEIDPNLTLARSWLGFAHVLIGRAEEAEPQIADALRLSPRDVFAHLFL
jgi:tetratricopeptide (TPR) repeat protein